MARADKDIDYTYGGGDDVEEGHKQANGSMSGVGKLLHEITGKAFTTWYFKTEQTTLEFYEHVVVARITSKLWCFPERYFCEVIPRFKVTNAAFSKGPKGVNKLLVFLLASVGIVFVIIGLIGGGCTKYCNRVSCQTDSGTCALTVIGFLLLFLALPLVIIVSWLRKEHFVFLTTKLGSTGFLSRGGTQTTAYAFRKFERDRGKQTILNEAFLVDYVYGSLSKGGDKARDEAHILAHFNDASLATPIMPIYADKTSEVLPRIVQRKNGGNGGSPARSPNLPHYHQRYPTNATGGKPYVVSPPRTRPAYASVKDKGHYTPEESNFDVDETQKAMKQSPYD